MKNDKVFLLTKTALFTSMIFVLTRFISIPVASGYVHFGDALGSICAMTLGGVPALFAAAIGEMLADLSYGFINYAFATLVIKTLIALPFVFIYKKSDKILTPLSALFTIFGGIITVGGYFVADLFIDKAYAVVDISGNVIQAAGSVLIFVFLASAMDRLSIKQKLFPVNKEV